MRKLAIVMMLALVGCADTVDVLSSDGSKDLGWCGRNWVECINTRCPNGFDVVKKPDAPPPAIQGIVRCK